MPHDASATTPASATTSASAITPASAPPSPPPTRLAVVGAGPVGLALSLFAARLWPEAEVTLFDARAPGQDVAGDPRTLALMHGSSYVGDGAGALHALADFYAVRLHDVERLAA